MIKFVGGIGSISQHQISGLVRTLRDGIPELPGVVLRFETLGDYLPTQTRPSDEGWLNFQFDLPAHFKELSWESFLNEFVAVIAYFPNGTSVEQWSIPLHKNTLAGLNATALKYDKIRAYGSKPNAGGRIAAFTIVYNEHTILPLWIRYYSHEFGARNIFIIDHGSDRPYETLPNNVSIIRLPRDEFDNWTIARIVAFFQRVLLESYDSVLYTDSDEFVCTSQDARNGRSLSQYLLELPEPIGITRSYNLHHDVLVEPTYDPTRPVLSQRKMITRQRAMDKPLISRVPLSWIPGFHAAHEGGVPVAGLFMLHLRWFDLNVALIKGGHYRSSKWNPYDVEAGLAYYQRDDESKIVLDAKRYSESFAGARESLFDAEAEISVVPEWMREAIFI